MFYEMPRRVETARNRHTGYSIQHTGYTFTFDVCRVGCRPRALAASTTRALPSTDTCIMLYVFANSVSATASYAHPI